jgi:hypothetical protein
MQVAKGIVWPQDAFGSPILFAGGAALGYLYAAPFLGASELVSALLVSWAVARSTALLISAEVSRYNSSAGSSAMLTLLGLAAVPLGAMYLSSMLLPLDSVVGGLVAYAAYVAVPTYVGVRALGSL